MCGGVRATVREKAAGFGAELVEFVGEVEDHAETLPPSRKPVSQPCGGPKIRRQVKLITIPRLHPHMATWGRACLLAIRRLASCRPGCSTNLNVSNATANVKAVTIE